MVEEGFGICNTSLPVPALLEQKQPHARTPGKLVAAPLQAALSVGAQVSKREGDSSLMQLREEFCSYEALRREHDAQIVQIASEAGLRIAPEQWSSLLYGDAAHRSHMQSLVDKLQSPQSFAQSLHELTLALQRTGDPAGLAALRPHFDRLLAYPCGGEYH